MPDLSHSNAANPKKLLDQMRDKPRLRNYSYETEKTYVSWARRYILFHDKRHPLDMGKPELEAFLTHLAVEQDVAPSTQNQALQAILFLYREVLEQPILGDVNALRAREHRRLPTVLTQNQVRAVLNQLTGVYHLCAALACWLGCGDDSPLARRRRISRCDAAPLTRDVQRTSQMRCTCSLSSVRYLDLVVDRILVTVNVFHDEADDVIAGRGVQVNPLPRFAVEGQRLARLGGHGHRLAL